MIDQQLNQQELADKLGVTRQPISKFFNRKAIDQNLFARICMSLGLEWDEIADLEDEEPQNITSRSTKSPASFTRRVRSVNEGYTLSNRLILFCEPASTWLKKNAERLSTEACETVLNQIPEMTNIDRKRFKNDIGYYLNLVIGNLLLIRSTIYYKDSMRNHFSLGQDHISLYVQAFEQIKRDVCRTARTKLSLESVAELELRIDELLDYLDYLEKRL